VHRDDTNFSSPYLLSRGLSCSQKTSTTFNTFMYLSLPIPNKRGISKVSLTQCLDAFLKEEIMEKDDAWLDHFTNIYDCRTPLIFFLFDDRNCPKCKTRRKATKRLSLSKLPPILLIHLKRFSFKGPFSDKLETFVQYPLYGLDLSTYVPPPLTAGSLSAEHRQHYEETARSTPESNIYDLYAVCNHFGSLSSGHCSSLPHSLSSSSSPY
jgi:ubiquitin carboxyl-terminal hydrolase 8